MAITLKRLVPGDEAVLENVAPGVFDEPVRPDLVRRFLATPNYRIIVAFDGDLVVGSFRNVWRINASDGTTVWNAPRTGSVSGSCGAARYGDAVYVADAAAGGTVLKRFSLATGTFAYASPVMPGATLTDSWSGTELPDERFVRPEDVAEAVFSAWSLSPRAVVEEMIIRPQLGDI